MPDQPDLARRPASIVARIRGHSRSRLRRAIRSSAERAHPPEPEGRSQPLERLDLAPDECLEERRAVGGWLRVRWNRLLRPRTVRARTRPSRRTGRWTRRRCRTGADRSGPSRTVGPDGKRLAKCRPLTLGRNVPTTRLQIRAHAGAAYRAGFDCSPSLPTRHYNAALHRRCRHSQAGRVGKGGPSMLSACRRRCGQPLLSAPGAARGGARSCGLLLSDQLRWNGAGRHHAQRRRRRRIGNGLGQRLPPGRRDDPRRRQRQVDDRVRRAAQRHLWQRAGRRPARRMAGHRLDRDQSRRPRAREPHRHLRRDRVPQHRVCCSARDPPRRSQFTAAGSLPYLCSIHPGMAGTVNVVASGTTTTQAEADAKATLTRERDQSAPWPVSRRPQTAA